MKKYDLIIFTDWFVPAFKGGGPIRSIANLCSYLSDNQNILVITGDRDLGDTKPFDGITANEITSLPIGVDAIYLSPNKQRKSFFKELLAGLDFRTAYLNSMFSPGFSIAPLMALRSAHKNKRIVLASRGMLAPNALKQRAFKKRLYLTFFKILGLHKLVHFQATDTEEAQQIIKHLNSEVSIVGNAPAPQASENIPATKQENHLRLITICRITSRKNVKQIYEVLNDISEEYQIHHTMIGPNEEKGYWEEVEKLRSALKPNIASVYRGALDRNEVENELKQAHAFIYPTLGENFGHSIFEALSQGKPLIISDLTPWKNLAERNAGWDIPLNNHKAYVNAVEQLAAMNQEEYTRFSERAFNLAKNYIRSTDIVGQYLELFQLKAQG